MTTRYEITIYDPSRRQLLARLRDFTSLDYVLNENAAGGMTLTLPPVVPFDFFVADTQLEIWRYPDGQHPVLEGGTQWFVQKATLNYGVEQGYQIDAVDAMALLERRFVMYYAGSNQSTATDNIDDIMKRVVRENFQPAGFPITGRVIAPVGWSASGLVAVEADKGELPSITKGFAWRRISDLLTDLAAESLAAGTYVAYRFRQIDATSGVFSFRTYPGSFGADRRAVLGVGGSVVRGKILTPESNTLIEAKIERDYSGMLTAVVAGGQGEGAGRILGGAVVDVLTPWGYREQFIDKTDTGVIAELNNYAAGQLALARPKLRFSGRVNETPNNRYGVDYGLGWLLTARVANVVSDCRVTQVHVNIAQSTGEVIEARIASETVVQQ